MSSDRSGPPSPAQRMLTPPPSNRDILKAEVERHPRAFHVCHINAESLVAHMDDVADIFYDRAIHAVLVSETFLKPELPDSAFSLNGYNIFRNDRVGKGGGGWQYF